MPESGVKQEDSDLLSEIGLSGGGTTEPSPAPDEPEEPPPDGDEDEPEEPPTEQPSTAALGSGSGPRARRPLSRPSTPPDPRLGSGDPRSRQETEDLPIVGPLHLSRSIKALNVTAFENAVADFVVEYLRENMDRRFPVNWPAVKAVLSRLPRTIQRRVSSLASSSEYAKRRGIAAEREKEAA